MTPLTPELMNLLVHVVKGGSISAGARTLNMSPSLATRKLAQLETALKARLFERTTRQMRLTEAGVLALRWAERSLDSQAQLIDEISSLQEDPRGIVRLVTTQYSASEVLPPLLRDFTGRYPQIRLSVSTSDTLVNLVESHYDVAVHSGRLPDSGLVAQRVQTFERIICASPAYLSKKGVPKQPSDLATHQCLSHVTAEPRNWFFKQGNRMVAQSIDPFIEADEYGVLLSLARASIGIVRLGYPLVATDLAAGRLIRLMPDFQCVYSSGEMPGLWVMYLNRQVMKRTRLLIDFLTQRLSHG